MSRSIPGKYSVHGTPAFDARVEADMQKIVQTLKSDPEVNKMRSVILLGGYGRGEGTPFLSDGKEIPFNDYDLLVLVDELSPHLRRRIGILEDQLSNQLKIAVDLYPQSLANLKHAERSLLNYEMQKGHRVIWGSSDALSVMPNIALQQVPLNEGTRLLMNRGKLLLDIQNRLDTTKPLTEEEMNHFRKFLWKNHLAFGDCALLLAEEYDILYQIKQTRVHSLYKLNPPDPAWMIDAYLQAIEFKHQGNPILLPGKAFIEEWQATQDYWKRFLLWFEGARLNAPIHTLDDYFRELPEKETKEPKSVLRNIHTVGWRMIFPSLTWLTIHPRTRLYPALYLLLDKAYSDKRLAQLLAAEGDRETLLQRFYLLRSRLS